MKNRILYLLFILLTVGNSIVFSQNVSFNSTGTQPNASAVLDLSNSTNGGFLVPCMTTGQIASIPTPLVTSLLIYNTTTNCFESYYSGTTSWVVDYCLCGGAPGALGAITANPNTHSPALGANETFSVAAITGATSYTWTLPTGSTITTGSGTNSITAVMGCLGGNVSVTASNSCGTNSAVTYSINANNSSPATPASITGSTSICTNSIQTYSTSSAGAASYTWTVPAAVGTISGSSTGSSIAITANSSTGSGTMTVTATDACGTSAQQTLAVSVITTPVAPTISGTSTIITSSTGNTFTATSATATSFTWTVPASVGTITAGQGTATITVTANASAGSGNITCTATNACGTSGSSANYAVTVSSCTPTAITLDASVKSGVGTSVFNITTTGTNELVIISASGYAAANPVNFTGSVSVNQGIGAATYYGGIATHDAEIAVYWFVAPTAKTYQITVTETGYTEYDNFAAALKGMCSPTAADIVHTASNTLSNFGGTSWQISAALTENASSYALGFYTDFWQTSPTPQWVNLSDFASSDANGAGHDDYSMAGQAITTAGTPTITAEEGGAGYIDYACIYLLNIK